MRTASIGICLALAQAAAVGCASGSSSTDSALGRAPVRLAGVDAESGLYDDWSFYGQDAQYESVQIETTRDDGALASITATPSEDGSVLVHAAVDGESAELELGAHGALVSMYADGANVRALLGEAARDLAHNADALTWDGEAADGPAPGEVAGVAGAVEALGVPQWVLDLDCTLAKISEYLGGAPAAIACDVTLTPATRIAMARRPAITFAFENNRTVVGAFGVAGWSSSTDVTTTTRWNLPSVATSSWASGGTFYLTLAAKDRNLAREGWLRFDVYGSWDDYQSGRSPASTSAYYIANFGTGARMKRVVLSPMCDVESCLGALQTCNGNTCEQGRVEGNTLPYADRDVLDHTQP